ncbi:hypothetical protein CN495_08570 [Bacillus thuringiensis]|uniref:YopX protein domain-containing protein n=1 Tax=Bacillus thuringiensis TaxID=1428 RepID=A0ABD6S7I2_BACTU|nr:hypothetical protein [Bacillus thuringiensis]PER55794.1 hypothetical protein CN495_08570 [Bacillus thuringiensis]
MRVAQYQGLNRGGRLVYGMARTETRDHVEGYKTTHYIIESDLVFKDSIGIYIGESDQRGEPLYVGDIVDVLDGTRFTGVRGVIEWCKENKQMELVVYSDFSPFGYQLQKFPFIQLDGTELRKTGHYFTELQKSYGRLGS